MKGRVLESTDLRRRPPGRLVSGVPAAAVFTLSAPRLPVYETRVITARRGRWCGWDRLEPVPDRRLGPARRLSLLLSLLSPPLFARVHRCDGTCVCSTWRRRQPGPALPRALGHVPSLFGVGFSWCKRRPVAEPSGSHVRFLGALGFCGAAPGEGRAEHLCFHLSYILGSCLRFHVSEGIQHFKKSFQKARVQTGEMSSKGLPGPEWVDLFAKS